MKISAVIRLCRKTLLFGLTLGLCACVNLDANKAELTSDQSRSAKTALPSSSEPDSSPPTGGALKTKGDWNDFPDYLQNLVEGMQTRWETLAKNSRHRPKYRSTVAVTFLLNSEGRIEKIVSVTGTADKLAGSWCVAAIQPSETFSYGRWNEEMIRKLDHSQELTFNFIYK